MSRIPGRDSSTGDAEKTKMLSAKVHEQSKQISDLTAQLERALEYARLCERRITELDPDHPIPVLPSHIGQPRFTTSKAATPKKTHSVSRLRPPLPIPITKNKKESAQQKAKLEQQVALLQRQLAEKTAREKELHAQLEQKENELLEAKKAKLRSSFSRNSSDKPKSPTGVPSQRLVELEATVARLQQEKASLEAALEAERAAAQDQHTFIEVLRRALERKAADGAIEPPDEVLKLHKQLHDKEQALRELEQELRARTIQRDELEARYRGMVTEAEENTALQEELVAVVKACRAENADLSARLNEATAKLAAAEAALKDHTTTIERPQARLAQSAAPSSAAPSPAISFAQSSADNARAHDDLPAVLETALRTTERVLRDREAELLMLREKLTRKGEKIRALQSALKATEERLAEATRLQSTRLDGTAAELDSLRAAVSAKEREVDELRAALSEQHKSSSEQQGQLQRQLETAQQELQKKEALLASLVSDTAVLSAKLQAELKESKELLAGFRMRTEQKEAELAAITEQLRLKADQLEKTTAALEGAKAELDRQRGLVASLEEQLQSMRSAWEHKCGEAAHNEQLLAQVTDLLDEKVHKEENYLATVESLTREKAALAAAKDSASAEAAKLSDVVQSLQRQLAEVQDEKQRVESQLEELAMLYTELEEHAKALWKEKKALARGE